MSDLSDVLQPLSYLQNIQTYRKMIWILSSHPPKGDGTQLHSSCKGGKFTQSGSALDFGHSSFFLLQSSWEGLWKINSPGDGLLHKIGNTYHIHHMYDL